LQAITAKAFARAALAGNPSDGYGGRTVALCLADWCAQAEIHPGGGPAAARHDATLEPLVKAALARIGRMTDSAEIPGTVSVRTSIPRQVGLGGSSAIVIAVMRAAAAAHGLELAPAVLAREALAAENEDLGIAAGPQDRVIQAHQGLLDMDFSNERVEPIDPALLPPLVLAHRVQPGRHSGDSHAELRAHLLSGEPGALAGIQELADCAARAARAVRAGDRDELARALDDSFDTRARIMDVDPEEAEGVWIARRHGAAVNYAGSGGAVVALPPPGREQDLIQAFTGGGWAARRVRIAAADEPNLARAGPGFSRATSQSFPSKS
jgi:glucuronokinase